MYTDRQTSLDPSQTPSDLARPLARPRQTIFLKLSVKIAQFYKCKQTTTLMRLVQKSRVQLTHLFRLVSINQTPFIPGPIS